MWAKSSYLIMRHITIMNILRHEIFKNDNIYSWAWVKHAWCVIFLRPAKIGRSLTLGRYNGENAVSWAKSASAGGFCYQLLSVSGSCGPFPSLQSLRLSHQQPHCKGIRGFAARLCLQAASVLPNSKLIFCRVATYSKSPSASQARSLKWSAL